MTEKFLWAPWARLFAAWAVVGFSACTLHPTPYQPLKEGFGFEETKLQEKIYKVSFRANRATQESAVLDYLYLRSAELTRAAGYTHFLVQQELGKSQLESRPRSRVHLGLGFSSGMGGGLWGMGAGMPLSSSDYESSVSYHLGVFLIRLLTPAEAQKERDALEVGFLLKSIKTKMDARAASQD